MQEGVNEEDVAIPNYNGTFLHVGGINEMIHPEMFIQSLFRQGKVTILGEKQYLNRTVTVFQIKFTDPKLGDTEKLWFDNETGIVLKDAVYSNIKQIISINKQ